MKHNIIIRILITKGKAAYKKDHFNNASHNDHDQNNDLCYSDQNSDEDNEDSLIAHFFMES